MLRHEQQTVRMALEAALHHSAGPKEKVEMQQNGAPRGQKTAARAGEEVEYEKHAGLRAQKTPPPGERPGILAEPGPQRSDRTVEPCSRLRAERLPVIRKRFAGRSTTGNRIQDQDQLPVNIPRNEKPATMGISWRKEWRSSGALKYH